jgi:hypothetical protein
VFSLFSLGSNSYAAAFLRGTFAPERRASDKPIAIACFGFVTFLPLRPLFSLPRFIAFISRSTDFPAFGLYLRPVDFFLRLLDAVRLRAVEPLRELALRRELDELERGDELRLADDFLPRDEDDFLLRDDVPRDEPLRVDFLVAAMRI